MAFPGEEENAHAAFDDDADLEDTEGEDSEMEDDEDEDEGGHQRAAPPPPPPPQNVAGYQDLNYSTPSTSTSSDPALNPNPNANTNASAVPQNGVIQALPLSTAVAVAVTADLSAPSPARRRRRASASEEKKPASIEDSRRLFQRLWTDEDEITILEGFLEFTSQRGTTHASHQYDTGPFYEQIKNRLQLDFTKNQLIEKLRRLKKKFRTAANRMGSSSGKEFVFKSPHDKATYDISEKIWSASIKKSRDSDDDDLNPHPNNSSDGYHINAPNDSAAVNSRSQRRGRKRSIEEPAAVVVAVKEEPPAAPPVPSSSSAPDPIPSAIEETVKSCLSPLFKELSGPFGSGIRIGGLALNLPVLGLGGNSANPLGSAMDEKWRKQQILELEVFLKRTELVREHIRSTLEELRSSASGS